VLQSGMVPVIGVIPNDASLRGFASSVEGIADGCRSQLDLCFGGGWCSVAVGYLNSAGVS